MTRVILAGLMLLMWSAEVFGQGSSSSEPLLCDAPRRDPKTKLYGITAKGTYTPGVGSRIYKIVAILEYEQADGSWKTSTNGSETISEPDLVPPSPPVAAISYQITFREKFVNQEGVRPVAPQNTGRNRVTITVVRYPKIMPLPGIMPIFMTDSTSQGYVTVPAN